LAWFVRLLALFASSSSPSPTDLAGKSLAKVVSADAAANKLTIQPADPSRPALAVPSEFAGTIAKSVGLDDSVWYTTGSDGKTINAVGLKQTEMSWTRATGAVLVAFALVWGGVLLVTCGHPWVFALGVDGRISNSQTQLYLWFMLFATIYLTEIVVRTYYTGYFGGIGAPAKLLALSGISALTFGAARANATLKDGAAKTPPPSDRTRLNLLLDLFTSDSPTDKNGRRSLGDFQMIVLTGAAIAVYLVTSIIWVTKLAWASHVDLPPVDDTLLGGTAASQGAYLFKKIASPAGH